MGTEIVQPILTTSSQESYLQKACGEGLWEGLVGRARGKGYPMVLTQLPEIRVQPTQALVRPGVLQ